MSMVYPLMKVVLSIGQLDKTVSSNLLSSKSDYDFKFDSMTS